MTLKTVSWVASEAHEWKGEKGVTFFVNVKFADGDVGSLGKKDAAKAEELRKLLEGLKDTEAEFGFDDSGKKTDEGKTKWRIKSFPGYEPEPYSGGGGKREYVPRFVDTEVGWRESDERVDRRRSLELAVQARPEWTDTEILAESAAELYNFLRATSDSGTTSHPKVAQADRAPVPTTPKHSPSVPESATSAPAVIGSAGTDESGSGVANEDGEASDATPDPGQLPHEAVWIPSPKVKSMVVCEVPRCVLHPARRKDEVPA